MSPHSQSYQIIGRAVMIDDKWWWIEDFAKKTDMFVCWREGVTKEFHENDFQVVV